MDYKDITAILLKTIGAVLIFWHLTWLPASFVYFLKEPFDAYGFLVVAVPAFLGLGIGVFIFTFPATISNKLIAGAKLSKTESFTASIQIVILRLIGIYHVFIALTDLLGHFSKAILISRQYKDMGMAQSGWTPDTLAWTIATLLELAIAIWFVLGAEGIVRMIQKIRGRADF